LHLRSVSYGISLSSTVMSDPQIFMAGGGN
jgi:hypothetical protein